MNIRRAALALCLVPTLLVACNRGVEKDIADIRAKQDEILSKLAAIQDAQNKLTAARQGPPSEDFDKVYAIDLGDSPVRGDAGGKVTIVEFSDFQCPFCARAEPLLTQVLQKYPKGVRFVYKQFPLPPTMHPVARPAALWSLAAQSQGKFWEMHDVLIQNQATLDPAKADDFAKQAGLDVKRFKSDLEKNADAYNKRIEAEMALGNSVDVRGTPTLFIGGKKVRNRTVDGMSAMIDAELAKGS
jgi:protein-disulfide isomerase